METITCPNTDCGLVFDPQMEVEETLHDGHTVYCPTCDCEMQLNVSTEVHYSIDSHEFEGYQ